LCVFVKRTPNALRVLYSLVEREEKGFEVAPKKMKEKDYCL